MKTIINVAKAIVLKSFQKSGCNAAACAEAFYDGFNEKPVPRVVRKIMARSELHRQWLRGKITKAYTNEGICMGSGGRVLPFKINPSIQPNSVTRFDVALDKVLLVGAPSLSAVLILSSAVGLILAN